jgi:poly-gamma-glutamate capsule biosynthesis protein CapA/YwtB (metallophosphatase superfamily)
MIAGMIGPRTGSGPEIEVEGGDVVKAKRVGGQLARIRGLRKLAVIGCAAGHLSCGHHTLAQTAAPNAARLSNRDPNAETVMKITAPFTVTAVGDIIEPQPLYSNDPAFQKLVARIRQADVGFGNMESSLVDFHTFQGPVAGTEAPLEMGDAIKAMGITLMSRANNHTFDGGVMGMISTDEALDKLGIVHAGTGRNLQEARAAHYFETPKGRVGLVSLYSVDDSSNYGPNYAKTEATYRNGNIGGAPGLNPLHLTTYHVVSPEQLQTLRQIAGSVYGSRGRDSGGVASAGAAGSVGTAGIERFRFFDEWYQGGADVGSLHYEMNPNDEKDILQSVRNGKVYSDFMIVTIHAHQTTNYGAQGIGGVDHNAADFVVKLAHDSVDNGADMFVAHGVHALHGVEIYNGKPIFYGVSNFVFQFGLQFGSGYDIMANEKGMSALENPASQETVLTSSRFEGGKLKEVRLYPVDLGGSRRPISQMGIPLTPSPDEAQRILKELQEYSQPFGTKISIEDNVGVIRVDAGRNGHDK